MVSAMHSGHSDFLQGFERIFKQIAYMGNIHYAEIPRSGDRAKCNNNYAIRFWSSKSSPI